MSENNGNTSTGGMKLIQVILVPVDFHVEALDDWSITVGWNLADHVGGESDRHSHRGKIYRKADAEENWSSFEDDVIFVYVPEVELPKFDRVFYVDEEG